jgi:hypothetical protein
MAKGKIRAYPKWRVGSWPYQQTLNLSGTNLPGPNTLAYYVPPSVMKKKRFMTLTSGTNVIKLFWTVMYELDYKARILSLVDLSSLA